MVATCTSSFASAYRAVAHERQRAGKEHDDGTNGATADAGGDKGRHTDALGESTWALEERWK